MKKPKNSTVPSGDAIPAAHDPLAPQGWLSCTIDMSALRGMSMGELRALRDTLNATHKILCAFSCQPRFAGSDDHSQNAAGDLLEDISEWIAGYEQAVVNVAQAMAPETARDAEIRSWTLLGFHADLMDNLPDFAVMASEAARDEVRVKWREDHPCRAGAA